MQSLTYGILTRNMQCCMDSRMRDWSFKPIPFLLLLSALTRRWRNCSLPGGESSLVPYNNGVISYPSSYSYHPLHAHPLGSDRVLGLVFSDDVAPCLYSEATLCPSQHSFVTRPLALSTFPPPRPFFT